MVLLPNNENFSAASGLINVGLLENIYHSVMDEAFIDLGRTITLHLKPIVEQDSNTQSRPASQQYNPYFQRVAGPNTNTRNTGTKITPRDVNYKAQIKVGPLSGLDDLMGIGTLL